MSLTQAIDTCDLRALIAHHCGHDAARALGECGGTIRDPRPGMQETHPSFSVWRSASGTWMWKKRGRNSGQGTAFTFLTSLGLTGTQARAELLRFTQTPSAWEDGPGGVQADPRPDRDLLQEAQEKLAQLRPATWRALHELRARLSPIREGSAPARELQRRGLWPLGDLEAFDLGGHLAFLTRGPDGRPFNVKRRDLGGRSRYQVLIPGHGTPAWCNPGYGRATRVLLIEGELNAAAAWRAVQAHGLDFDVQGLPGTDTWPFLAGLDREVWVYADVDDSGERMRARMQDLAFACGAPRVHQIPALAQGDFCDVLGQGGPDALEQVIHAQEAVPQPELGALDAPLWPADLEAAAHARTAAPLFEQVRDYAAWPLMRP